MLATWWGAGDSHTQADITSPEPTLIKIGIDGSNLRRGGGVTHLIEFLANMSPLDHGIGSVKVWGSKATISQLPDRLEGVTYETVDTLDRSLLHRLFWWRVTLPRIADRECDILFSPGGLAAHTRIPVVTMSRNMLPFQHKERARFGISGMRLKLWMLRRGQIASFRRANGLIFLSRFAQAEVCKQIPGITKNVVVIPHGVNDRFLEPADRVSREYCTGNQQSLQVLYVSRLHPYKHHDQVLSAARKLAANGTDVTWTFVGGGSGYSERNFKNEILKANREGVRANFIGQVAFEDLPQIYAAADIFVFASSCENLPNTLVEAMASGLAIACSNSGPMPEILGDAGKYFDPESATEIADTVQSLAASRELRKKLSERAVERAKSYSWHKCSRQTLTFLQEVALRRDVPRKILAE